MLLDSAIGALFTPRHLRDTAGAIVPGSNIWKSGAVFGRPVTGFQHGMKNVVRGQLPFTLLAAGFAAGTAPRGHALSAVSRSVGGLVGGLLGATFGGGFGMVAGQAIGDASIGRGLEKAVQTVADIGSNRGKIHMGGDYEDSQQAWTMRQVAVQQMSTSMLNARRWLGSEAAFMHT